MRRTALVVILLMGALSLVAAGCGQEQDQSAAPETVQGEVPTTTETETTESETTETKSTETQTTESETTETTPPPQGDAAAGKTIFLGTGTCGGCHTLADAGSTATVGPNLDDVQPPYDKVVTQVTNGGGTMPAFKDTLTEQQIADVAAYVSSVAGK